MKSIGFFKNKYIYIIQFRLFLDLFRFIQFIISEEINLLKDEQVIQIAQIKFNIFYIF